MRLGHHYRLVIAYTRTLQALFEKKFLMTFLEINHSFTMSSAPGYYRVVDNGAMFYESSTNTVGWGDSNM